MEHATIVTSTSELLFEHIPSIFRTWVSNQLPRVVTTHSAWLIVRLFLSYSLNSITSDRMFVLFTAKLPADVEKYIQTASSKITTSHMQVCRAVATLQYICSSGSEGCYLGVFVSCAVAACGRGQSLTHRPGMHWNWSLQCDSSRF